jgi:hypothetical protein
MANHFDLFAVWSRQILVLKGLLLGFKKFDKRLPREQSDSQFSPLVYSSTGDVGKNVQTGFSG